MPSTTSRRLGAAVAALAVAGATFAVAGCERRSESAAPARGAPAARIVATAGHGADVLLDERVRSGQSVLDGLRDVTPVETAYGGGFVQAMLGRASSSSPRVDWFFYVNGIESPVGAADAALGDDVVVWWDHRSWAGMQSVRGVVGSWPEPFVHGAGSGAPRIAADPPLAAALRDAGARLTTGRALFRARVGADADLSRRDATWRAIDGDPGTRALAGGVASGRVVLMPPGGGAPEPVPGARAVAVLAPTGPAPADGAIFAVAGLDAASARAAATRIARDPSVLSLRYAVAFDGSGSPVRAAGREGP